MVSTHYAVEIFLPGITVTDSDIGAVVDGTLGYTVLRYVTDRPGYDGHTVSPHWEDTSNNDHVWHEGFLLDESMGAPNRFIELTGTGDYGTMSGFNFSISNAMVATASLSYAKTCEDNGIFFGNRAIKLYVVIDDVFYSIWQGIVSTTPCSETEFKFVCKSDFKTAHKTIPPTIINSTNYPDSISESQGKSIPICLGKIPYASTYNINGLPQETNLVKIGSTYYTSAQAVSYSVGVGFVAVTLKTPNMFWGWINLPADAGNDLAGKYLVAVAGGGSPDTSRCYKILSSSTLNFEAAPADYECTVILEELLDVDEATFNSTYSISGSNFLDRWQFKVYDIGMENVVSNQAVSGFKKDTYNRNQLFDYSEDDRVYRSVSSLVRAVSTAAPASITTSSNLVSLDGMVKFVMPVKCDFATAGYSNTTGMTISFYGTEDHVSDNDRGTAYTIIAYQAVADENKEYFLSIMSDFSINPDSSNFNLEKLWASSDFEYAIYSDCLNSSEAVCTIDLTLRDIYGETVTVSSTTLPVSVAEWAEFFSTEQLDVTRNLIGNDYYTNGGSVNTEASQFWNDYSGTGFVPATEMELPKEYLALIKLGALGSRCTLTIKNRIKTNSTGSVTLHLRIKEFACFGLIPIDTIGTKLYTRLSGETYGAYESNTVYRAFQKLLSDYDGLTIGENVTTTNVDTTNLSTTRHNATGYKWYVGYQIKEQKNAYDYYKSLCECSFVGMFQNRLGQKQLSSWIDHTASPHAHGPTTILRDSIRSYEKVGTADTYNEFFIRYNYDAGSEKCDKEISVTMVSEAAFPDEATLDANGNPVWKTYVSGVSVYASAKTLWDACHDAYSKTGVVNRFTKELLWFQDLRIYEDDQSATDGVDTDSSAFRFLSTAISWSAADRIIVEYSLPLNAATLQVELCDPITFSDTLYTNAAALSGWVCGISINATEQTIDITAILLH